MAIGQRLTIPLRESPSASSRVVESLPGSEVLWAQAVSPDGRWLEVVYDETGSTAWVLRSDVSLFGDPARLETGANPAQQDVPTPSSLPEGRVIANLLNVRAGPGENHTILGSLHAGERVLIIGRSPDGAWLQIERAGGDAWVAARYVTTAGASNPAIPQPVASRPAPERLKGKIAFQTRTGGDIYLMDADGSNLQRITDGIDPALSPDGTRLAFARWGAPHAILVRDLRTGEERQVVAANRPRGPAWSSDGSRLVFTYSTRSYTCLVSPFGCLEEEELRRRFGGDCLRRPRNDLHREPAGAAGGRVRPRRHQP
jgi:hypothetical protein